MVRDRAWRRHIEEKKVIQRLRRKCQVDNWWRGFKDVNGVRKYKITISDYLGTQEYFRSKTISTHSWDTKYKCKYSPNKFCGYSRDAKVKKGSTGLREKDKAYFFKILKEYGIK